MLLLSGTRNSLGVLAVAILVFAFVWHRRHLWAYAFATVLIALLVIALGIGAEDLGEAGERVARGLSNRETRFLVWQRAWDFIVISPVFGHGLAANLADMDVMVAVFLVAVVFAGLAVHAFLCRLARVDGDTFMVTSVAAVASPPFVPLMARALNNPGAILPGMTTGVIGYALGSYLGISLGLYLRSLQ